MVKLYWFCVSVFIIVLIDQLVMFLYNCYVFSPLESPVFVYLHLQCIWQYLLQLCLFLFTLLKTLLVTFSIRRCMFCVKLSVGAFMTRLCPLLLEYIGYICAWITSGTFVLRVCKNPECTDIHISTSCNLIWQTRNYC